MPLRKGERTLKGVRANLGVGASFRRKPLSLLDEMSASYEHWLVAQYKQTPPRMAQDATPAQQLQSELRKLGRRWDRRFNEAAPKLARWFSRSVASRSQRTLKRILAEAGISVPSQVTPAYADILRATVEENVSLIKSISEEYHREVEGMVMRSVVTGRDLKTLTRDLKKRYGVTQRRAELIARDQNNKATAAFVRLRTLEAGIERAVWLHSLGGKKPRPTHLKNNGKSYDVAKGWYDPDPRVRRFVHPGELINCRCVSKPIVKGFS